MLLPVWWSPEVGTVFSFGKKNQSKKEDKLKASLLSQELQSQILIESIMDGIIVTDTENKITLFNKGATVMTEWPTDEALNIDARTVVQLLQDDKTSALFDKPDHPFTKVLSTHEPFKETMQLVSRNGTRLYISLVVSPIIIPDTNELSGTVAVFRDVSREKNEEQQRADFVSTASHEMRTPVAAIEGYLALALNDKVCKIDAKAREYLEKAHSSSQHLGKLFQDLLTSAKAEDGRLTSHPSVVEMGKFTEQLAEDLRFGAEKKGLSMEFITSSIPNDGAGEIVDARGKVVQPFYYVFVDPDRIREVITNIFDNAVKYTPEGKISLAITGNNEVVQIRVSDTGSGIPKDDIPHLFQKFYRVDNSSTRTIGGTGLGLFICKKIVELYQGTIWAESEVNKGSTFYINLPRITTQRAHQLQEAEQNAKV